MVLESLTNPYNAEKHPWEMFFIGLVYSSVAIFLSLQIFESMAGMISVFITVMASIPIMYSTIKFEEKKDLSGLKEVFLLKEHSRALMLFTFLFLGVMVAYTLWYIFLPVESVHNLFSIQIETIRNINSNVVGYSSSMYSSFLKIFTNNVKVLMFCILFAFFYGAGAIFILTWNASVIAVAIGTFFRNNISSYAHAAGLHKLGGYFHIFSISFLRYMVHGLPEILAYFVGGLAGGIISVAVIKHDFRSKNFEKILLDAADLILIAFALLVVGGLIEVYITPSLF
ncbi:MAG: stage II sporulation protein M [Candidatus Woesearchaeota archaeon]